MKILAVRWKISEERPKVSILFYANISPTDPKLRDMFLHIDLPTLSEAVLTASIIEKILEEHFQIPSRSAVFSGIEFVSSSVREGWVQLRFFYRPEDFDKLTKPPLELTVSDKLLWSVFNDTGRDYFDYCAQKYAIDNMRQPSVDFRLLENNIKLREVVATVQAGESFLKVEYSQCRILCVTSLIIASGNYMNARRTIEGLCQQIPGVKIDWVLAHYDQKIPETKPLPAQVTLYQDNELWKMYPLIQYLSRQVDAIIGLPNNFLYKLQERFPGTSLILSQTVPCFLLAEYNASLQVNIKLPVDYVSLKSGINDSGNADFDVGIIKPEALILPDSISEKRLFLQSDPNARTIFASFPEAPLYFAYVYTPREWNTVTKISGLTSVDVLAIFIQHAKLCGQQQFKVVLGVSEHHIRRAQEMYPTILAHCAIQYYNGSTEAKQLTHGDVTVQIYNLFPFANHIFRALTDYAVACDTPVIATGDQSFIELFFTMTQGFVFLYQLLDHKQNLLEQCKCIATDNHLVYLEKLLTGVQSPIISEAQLMELSNFIVTHRDDLKRESFVFMTKIKEQPDLIESLSRVVTQTIAAQRSLLQQHDKEERQRLR